MASGTYSGSLTCPAVVVPGTTCEASGCPEGTPRAASKRAVASRLRIPIGRQVAQTVPNKNDYISGPQKPLK
eukprot:291198-Amphidinium_carterae.1